MEWITHQIYCRLHLDAKQWTFWLTTQATSRDSRPKRTWKITQAQNLGNCGLIYNSFLALSLFSFLYILFGKSAHEFRPHGFSLILFESLWVVFPRLGPLLMPASCAVVTYIFPGSRSVRVESSNRSFVRSVSYHNQKNTPPFPWGVWVCDANLVPAVELRGEFPLWVFGLLRSRLSVVKEIRV